MKRKFLSAVLALLVGGPPFASAQPAAVAVKDPEVIKGIKAVEDGDYDTAIVLLDGATRRLGSDAKSPDLPQAYLHLGIAYVGKGAEAAAKAQFREALKQIRDLTLSADRYPPKVINVFETARDEVSRENAGASPGDRSAVAAKASVPPRAPAKSGGGGKKALLVVGGVAAVGAGVAVAAGGGGGGGSSTPATGSGSLQTKTFASEVLPFGAGRDFQVDVTGSGTLTARCTWIQDGVVLGMYIVNLADSGRVLRDGGLTGAKEVSLSVDVTRGSYRISVTNSTGAGPVVDTTFTLVVTHP